MAEAMLTGLLKSGTAKLERVLVSEIFEQRRRYMADTHKVPVTASNADVYNKCNVIIFAIKPQVLDTVLDELRRMQEKDGAWAKQLKEKALFVSIIAGKTLATFEECLPGGRIARVMPNTPSLLGVGASAFVLGPHCRPEDGGVVETMMSSCGIAERVGDEGLLDAVTGLSGSGPAYVYLLVEAMSDGGVRMGLPRNVATRLAAQTVMGAGKMALEAGKHTGELKDAVTSPGGTTIAGVHALEAGAFRGTVVNAVQAATKRATELGLPKAKVPRL